MGESSAQSAESGDLGNYSTTGDFAIDGLNGINEPEESYIQEPDEYLEQDNLDPIEEANDSFTLSEEINGMEGNPDGRCTNAYEIWETATQSS